jgi:hypothetical protein
MDYIVLAVLQEWNVGHHIHRLNPGMPGEINMTCHMRFFFLRSHEYIRTTDPISADISVVTLYVKKIIQIFGVDLLWISIRDSNNDLIKIIYNILS